MRKSFLIIILLLVITACSKETPQYNSVCEKNDSVNKFHEYSNIFADHGIRIAQSYVETKSTGDKINMTAMNDFLNDPENEGLNVECPAYFGITKNGEVVTVLTPFMGSYPDLYESEVNSFRGINNAFDILSGTMIFYHIDEVNYVWAFDVYIDSIKQNKYKCDVIINGKYHSNDINKSDNSEEKKKKKNTIKEYIEKYDIEYANNKNVKSNEWNYFLVELPTTDDENIEYQNIDSLELDLNGERIKLYHATEIMNMP